MCIVLRYLFTTTPYLNYLMNMYLMTTENEILPCVKQKVGSATAVK